MFRCQEPRGALGAQKSSERANIGRAGGSFMKTAVELTKEGGLCIISSLLKKG